MKKTRTLFDGLSEYPEEHLDHIGFPITEKLLKKNYKDDIAQRIINELIGFGINGDLEAKLKCEKLKRQRKDYLI